MFVQFLSLDGILKVKFYPTLLKTKHLRLTYQYLFKKWWINAFLFNNSNPENERKQNIIHICFENSLNRPEGFGSRIHWLHLCRGLSPSPQRNHLLAVDGNPLCLRIESWWLSSLWLVTWPATHHFGPYWARRAVREARSNQSFRHVKPWHL